MLLGAIKADYFLDGAGTLQFGDKCLQGVLVFGGDYIFEDLLQLWLHLRERPRGAQTNMTVGIAEGAQQNLDLADVFDLSERHHGAQTNKPFWIGG